jgi:3-phytase
MKIRVFLTAVTTFTLAFAGCGGTAGRRVTDFLRAGPPPQPADTQTVVAVTETPPVADGGDAADDPAIWVNTADPQASLIVATNKRRGLVVYGLDGEVVSTNDVGPVNNVDLRAAVGGAGPEEAIVVAATNRTARTVNVFALDPATGSLSPLLSAPITPGFREEPYGLCMYRSAASGDLYVFAIDFGGAVEQWRLDRDGGRGLTGTRVRSWAIGSKTEGCVADDANGWLFVGEEEVGIWRYGAEPETAPTERVAVDSTGVGEDPEARLAASVEGVTLYAPQDGGPLNGFLIASSQGNNTYVVYDRAPPHAYRGTFRVGGGTAGVDGTDDTDGLDVVSAPLGPNYPMGLLVVQDGINVAVDGSKANQNFKFVSWQDVVEALNLTPGS